MISTMGCMPFIGTDAGATKPDSERGVADSVRRTPRQALGHAEAAAVAPDVLAHDERQLVAREGSRMPRGTPPEVIDRPPARAQ